MSQDELRIKFSYNGEYQVETDGSIVDGDVVIAKCASTKRRVADLSLFDIDDEQEWDDVYDEVLEWKYHRAKRNFSRQMYGKIFKGEPPLYLIPRERGGKSYKDVDLLGADATDIMFMPISKGYSMQGLSSFTLGPVMGEGLCLVNAAFSKSICIFHLVGGGKVDLKRKNFWKPGKAVRKIELVDDETMLVDGEEHDIETWLSENENLWLDEWDTWRKTVALCSRGDFHWGEAIIYKRDDKYLSFVDWKKQCYIQPSYDMLPSTPEFKFLEQARENGHALGLVHPKARGEGKIKPITREYLRELFDSDRMVCQPYVVAGLLLEVEIYE